MSHCHGTVTFKDGEVLHFEYNGTSDICIPALYYNTGEVLDNWRNHDNRKCTCGEESEEVVIFVDYALGYDWHGKACRSCMCITEGLDPDETDCTYDFNNYVQNFK